MKKCKSCLKEKRLDSFYQNTQGYYFGECKTCNISRSQKWNSLNKEKKKAFGRRDWWKHREKRIIGLKRSYDNREYGGNREKVIQRDKESCVRCGMTRREHHRRWYTDINVDHISRDRSDNRMTNLQTLCLFCHGEKDNGSIVKTQS